MIRRTVAPLLLTLSLSGCSSVYDLRAVVIDGKVAFEPKETDIWGEPDCIRSISVSAVNGPPASAIRGDSIGMVRNGYYWHQSFAVTSCENSFPVVYGAQLKRTPVSGVDEHEVKAKPLRVGVIYEVSTASEGSAYGGGRFTITKERKLVNLPL